jgi:hypothetical protein
MLRVFATGKEGSVSCSDVAALIRKINDVCGATGGTMLLGSSGETFLDVVI